MLKALNETMSKELKGNMKITSNQIENVKNSQKLFLKEPNVNYGVKISDE